MNDHFETADGRVLPLTVLFQSHPHWRKRERDRGVRVSWDELCAHRARRHTPRPITTCLECDRTGRFARPGQCGECARAERRTAATRPICTCERCGHSGRFIRPTQCAWCARLQDYK